MAGQLGLDLHVACAGMQLRKRMPEAERLAIVAEKPRCPRPDGVEAGCRRRPTGGAAPLVRKSSRGRRCANGPAPQPCCAAASWPAQTVRLEPASRPWQKKEPLIGGSGPRLEVSVVGDALGGCESPCNTQTPRQCPVSQCGAHHNRFGQAPARLLQAFVEPPGLDAAGVRRSPAGSAGGTR